MRFVKGLANYIKCWHMYLTLNHICPNTNTRVVHGSVRVRFVPNSEPTRQNRVNSLTTHRWPSMTSGRVGSVSSGRRSGRSTLVWVWITGSCSKSPYQAQIWQKSTNLSKNQRKTTMGLSTLIAASSVYVTFKNSTLTPTTSLPP